MKFTKLFILLLFQLTFSQQNKAFEKIKMRVSKTFFVSPEKAKKDAYLLKKCAQTNEEINTSFQYLGYIYDLTGKADSARYYFVKRLHFTKKHFYKTTNYYQSVIDFSNWGINYMDRTILVEELTLAISNIDKAKYQQEMGLMYLLLGDVLLKDGELDKANKYFDKSFKLIKGKFIAADYYIRKSKIDIIKQDYKSSKNNLIKGINSFSERNIFTYPQYLNKLGFTLTMLKEFKDAKKNLFESLYYQEKYGFKNLTAETYLNLYYLAKAEENLMLQKNYLDKAIEVDEGDIFISKEVYLGYKDYYSKTGDSEKEKESLKKFNQLNDSILNIEKIKLRTDLEYKLQDKESKKEISLKENIIQKEKKIKSLLIIGSSLLFILIVVLLILYFYKNKVQKKLRASQKKLHDEELKLMQEDQRKEIIKEKFKSKFDERKKLSMELHDGIANEISCLKLSFSNESDLSNSEINSIILKIDKLYNEVRNFSHELDPENITDVEFSQLVNNLCSLIERKGIKTNKKLLITKDIDSLDEAVLINLYRILQEIINNIIKHAKATEVQLEIYEDDNELIFFVKDNGVGLTNPSIEKTGIGLKNIKKRVEFLKGTYEFSNLKTGTSILIKIPKKVK